LLAACLGAGLGLAYFGGLWLTVQHLARRPRAAGLVALSRGLRLAGLGVAVYLLVRSAPGDLLAAAAGFWLARGYLLYRLGGAGHGE
jgi:F1F0 ATPase subunit 2